MTSLTGDPRFANMKSPRRIWTVSAIYGDREKLANIHEEIARNFKPGDRVVYFGNYTGGDTGGAAQYSAVQTIDDLLAFRKYLLAQDGVQTGDIVYLRGVQEEILQKLLQLQFARDPSGVFEWMLEHGIAQSLCDYGGNIEEGRRVCREGILSLTKWTNSLRQHLRRHPGHSEFMAALRRAAFTTSETPLLFVHAGIDPAKPLTQQQDNFWWKGQTFNDIHTAYDPFSYVIRGFDPNAQGVKVNGVTMTLDSATAAIDDMPITCGLLSGHGELLDLMTA